MEAVWSSCCRLLAPRLWARVSHIVGLHRKNAPFREFPGVVLKQVRFHDFFSGVPLTYLRMCPALLFFHMQLHSSPAG